MDWISSSWALPTCGLAVGLAMGFVARANHFCTLAALERHWYAGDSNGVRSWVLAAMVALIATQLLVSLGLAAPASSYYAASFLPLAGSILGGLMFGFGMALVGTCGFGAIVRLGGGSLRALVVLTGIALAAIAAQRGITGHFRVWVLDPVSVDLEFAGGQTLPQLLRAITGIDFAHWPGLVLGTIGIIWALRSPVFRRDRGKVIAGAVIGLCIAAGWVVTTHYSSVLFEPVQIEAGSFVAPLGDLMRQLIMVTGEFPDYGVGLVIGILIGAFLAAWKADDMRWEACDDARELGRHLAGAFLMGTGGVFALGCTIGQGVTAVSALALSAPLVIASIVFGARLGLGYLLEGDAIGFLRTATGNRQPG